MPSSTRAAIEILLNTPTIAEKIFTGAFNEIKGIMGRSRELGMCTFDWALFDLYESRVISFEEAIRNADSANELRLNIKLKSRRGEPSAFGEEALSIDMGPSDEELAAQKDKADARRRAEDEELERLREKKRLATQGGR